MVSNSHPGRSKRANIRRVSSSDSEVDEAGIKKSVSIQTKYFIRLVALGGFVAWLFWLFITVRKDLGYILATLACIFSAMFAFFVYKGVRKVFGDTSDFLDIPPPRK